MASDTVTTIFGAEDGPFQAVARRVHQTIEGLARFSPPAAVLKTFHSGFADIEHGAKAAAGGIGVFKGALMELMPLVAAISGVASVFAAFGKSISQASEREQAGQQFEAVAGGAGKAAAAVEKLEQVSAATGTDFPELAKGAKRLMEAGLSASQAADMTERLQKIALTTGSSFEDLADIYGRVITKQEVSAKDLVKLSAMGIPGIAELTSKFKELELATSDADRAAQHEGDEMRRTFEVQMEGMRAAYEQTEKTINAQTSLATKLGLTQKLFAQWAQGGRMTRQSGFGGLNETTIAALQTGLKQLERESGLTESQLRDFAQQGKIGFQDLLSAAQRFREEQEKQQERAEEMAFRKALFDMEEAHYKRQETLLEKQRDLINEVGEAIKKATDPGAIFGGLSKYLDTFAGKWREIAHDIQETFEALGKPLIDALKPVLDIIHDQWMPAMQEAAGNFGKWLVDEVNAFFEAFQTGDWSILLGQLKGVIESAAQMFADALAQLDFSAFTARFKDIFQIAANTLESMLAGESFEKLGNQLERVFTAAFASAVDASGAVFQSIGQLIFDGLKTAIDESGGIWGLLMGGKAPNTQGFESGGGNPESRGTSGDWDDLKGQVSSQTDVLNDIKGQLADLNTNLTTVLATG